MLFSQAIPGWGCARSITEITFHCIGFNYWKLEIERKECGIIQQAPFTMHFSMH